MQNSKGKAIASLVCGIVSVVLAWFGYGAIAGLAAGIVAIVLGVGVICAAGTLATAGMLS